MITQLFYIFTTMACLQLVMPNPVYSNDGYAQQECYQDERYCCSAQSTQWKKASVIGGAALVGAALGALTGNLAKRKGRSGSRGPVGPAANKVFDVGNTLSFTNTITITSVLAPGGHIEATAFVMQPDLSFVYVQTTTINTNGVFPIDLSYSTTDPEFGRWTVGYNIDAVDAIGTTVDFTNKVFMNSTRFLNNIPIVGLFVTQQFEFTLDHEDEQMVVEFPYFAIELQ